MQLNSFGSQVSHKRPKPCCEFSHSLTRSTLKIHVKGLSKLSTLIESSSTIHRLPCGHQFVQPCKIVRLRQLNRFTSLRIQTILRCFVLQIRRIKFFSTLTSDPILPKQEPCSQIELRSARQVNRANPPRDLPLELSPRGWTAVTLKNSAPRAIAALLFVTHSSR